MFILLQRNGDPFARTEIHRERLYGTRAQCDWCGRFHTTKARTPRAFVYAYRNESDGGRTYRVSGGFCSTGCMRCYHGEGA